jgi:aminoglycoside phosphotransferase (APT) family kinase protein
VLTPSGQVYLGTDNRRGVLRFVAPRRPGAADSTAKALRAASKAAGFASCALFAPVPFRHKFHQVLDVDGSSRMNFDLDVYRTRGRLVRPLVKAWDACNRNGALERRLYGFLPGLAGVLTSQASTRPVAERIFTELAAKRQIPRTAKLAGYHVRAKGVVVLTGKDAVIRLPLDEHAAAACGRHHRALETLAEDERIPARLRHLFPVPYAHGYFEGQLFFAESALAGESGRVFYSRGERRYDRAIVNAAYVLCQLRRATEEPTAIDQAEYDRLCGTWLGELTSLVPDAQRAGIIALARRLENALKGRTLPLGFHHGDYDFANLLYGDGEAVNAVLDFEVFEARGLPLIDLMVLLARRPIRKTGFAFGTLFARSILPRKLPRLEQELLEREIATLGVDEELYQALALCCWLNHLRLRRDSWLVRSPAWLEANLHEVLDTLRRMP